MKLQLRFLLTTLIAMICSSALALAESMDREAIFEHSSVRLLNGGFVDGAWSAGIEIRLPGEWKTYWKVPGDAGIPPDFDWSLSQNLAETEISWPAPGRYRDEAGESIGYKHHVVFPVKVVPKDPGRPVELRLKIFYAVCDNICIPGQAQIGLDLLPGQAAGNDASAIARSRTRVPVSDAQRQRIRDVRPIDDNGAVSLAVTVAGLDDPAQADIFVSGFTTIYPARPRLSETQTDSSIFHLRLDGAKTIGDLTGEAVDVVVVTGESAFARRIAFQ